MHLEVITRKPKKENGSTPLLFVHGGWHGAWCWEPFQSYFAEQGYVSHALSLRGHGNSEGRERLRWLRTVDFVADVVETVTRLPETPVLIGHCAGSYVIQKYLERYTAPAAVHMAPVPLSGSSKMFLRLGLRHPWQMVKNNLTLSPYALIETPSLARDALFSADMPDETFNRHFAKLQQESYLFGWETLLAPPRLKGKDLPPMLLLGALNDRFFSRVEIEKTARAYRAEADFFPDMAHDMMLEKDWMKVAERIVKWLRENKL